MEDERLLLRFKPAPNPRAGVMESSAAALGQQQKPPPSTSILERFRALVKEVAGGGEEEQVSGEEIVGIYEEVLGELTFNSKPVITELTIIAGEQREFGQGIADVICERILQVPVEQKLPSLYLLDSIVKNIGRDYVKYFTARLPQVFCEAYNQVESCLHPSMRHLFGTWLQVFPSSVLRKIETELQLSSQGSRQSSGVGNVRPSESPSPRPGHGIHINPKYLEARQRFEQSTMTRGRGPRDSGQITEFGGAPVGRKAAKSPRGWSGASSKFHDIQHHRGVSSSLDPYEQKAQYGDYDLDNSEVNPSLSGSTRISSLQVPEGRPTAILGNEKLLSFSKSDVFRSSAASTAPRSSVASTAPRMSDTNGWQESNTSPDDGFQKPEYQNAYNLANGISKHRPRDLIDAYGNNRGKNVLPEKPLKIQRLTANGINSEKITRKWQNTEEEEYVWEDMSPTLANRNGSNKIMPYGPNAGDFGIRTNLSRRNASVLDSDLGKSNWPIRSQLPRVDEPAPSNSGLMRSQRGMGRNDISHYQSSQYTQEPRKSHYVGSQSHQSLSPRSQGRIPLSVSGIATVGQRIPPYHRISDAEVPSERSPGIFPDSMNAGLLSSAAMDNRVAQISNSPPAVSVIWPLHKSLSLYGSQPDSAGISKPLVNQGSPSYPLHWQLPDAGDRKASNPNIPIRITHSGSGSTPLNLCGLEPVLQFQPRDPHGNIIPSASAQSSSHLVGQSLNQVQVQGQPSIQSLVPPNSELSSSSFLMNRLPDTSFHTHGGALPPLPPGPPPSVAHIASRNSGSLISTAPGSGFSGLINSLVSQGLISLGPVTSSKDSIGVEFDPELLKVRHESAINDLYVNLPRQCTTCGLRFKCQEEHSSHMDWHVTKNRMSKNRKQKPSRNWFVSAKEWLSGAETLGTDVVPGFLPAETIVDKDEEKELVVPADDSQNLCALCGEPFEDFYSDEADEWMYRGAVYLNAHEGSIEGLDRSQLGPIVHAKCRSESSVIQRQS